jgi:hypothetical protein
MDRGAGDHRDPPVTPITYRAAAGGLEEFAGVAGGPVEVAVVGQRRGERALPVAVGGGGEIDTCDPFERTRATLGARCA